MWGGAVNYPWRSENAKLGLSHAGHQPVVKHFPIPITEPCGLATGRDEGGRGRYSPAPRPRAARCIPSLDASPQPCEAGCCFSWQMRKLRHAEATCPVTLFNCHSQDSKPDPYQSLSTLCPPKVPVWDTGLASFLKPSARYRPQTSPQPPGVWSGLQ